MARKKANANLDDVEELGLQLTPMIDVIFQLLIFFLVNIKFRTLEGLLKANLPTSKVKTQSPEEIKDISVYVAREKITGKPILTVDGVPVRGNTPEQQYEALYKELEQRKDLYVKEMGVEMPAVIIMGDNRVAYKWIVKVLNVCGGLDIKKVTFGQQKKTQ